MNSAVWGALGAIGGAGLAALGAYLGPVRAARAAAQERAQERRDQRETGEVDRLIALRRAYRDWERYLRLVFEAAANGNPYPTPEAAAQRLGELEIAAGAAVDALMHDRWWMQSEAWTFQMASGLVLRLARGDATAYTRREAEAEILRVRSVREGLNDRIMDRLAQLAHRAGDSVEVAREDP